MFIYHLASSGDANFQKNSRTSFAPKTSSPSLLCRLAAATFPPFFVHGCDSLIQSNQNHSLVGGFSTDPFEKKNVKFDHLIRVNWVNIKDMCSTITKFCLCKLLGEQETSPSFTSMVPWREVVICSLASAMDARAMAQKNGL